MPNFSLFCHNSPIPNQASPQQIIILDQSLINYKSIHQIWKENTTNTILNPFAKTVINFSKSTAACVTTMPAAEEGWCRWREEAAVGGKLRWWVGREKKTAREHVLFFCYSFILFVFFIKEGCATWHIMTGYVTWYSAP